MTGLLGGANYSLNQASYDLARLSRNGLNTFRGTRTTAKVSAAKGLSAPYARPAQQPSARPAGGQLDGGRRRGACYYRPAPCP
jgi:hypothetical protein